MKQGYHAVYPKDFFEGIDDACKYGFDFVQFDLGVPRFFLDDLSNTELANIRDYAKDKNVEITFHSPGDNVSLFCDYPLIRKGILDEFKLILEKANYLNARHVTFHAGAYPQFKKSGCKTDNSYSLHYEKVFYENLKYLTDNSGNTLVCIENSSLDQLKRNVIKKLIDENSPLYLTLDTAKMYLSEADLNQEDYEFFTEYKRFVREMHIHDRNKQFCSHQIVGTGTVDFNLFRDFCGDDVYINYEVRPVEAAKKSKNLLMKIWNV